MNCKEKKEKRYVSRMLLLFLAVKNLNLKTVELEGLWAKKSYILNTLRTGEADLRF